MKLKRRDLAVILIAIVDALYIVWGAMAAISPDELLKGPGGVGILPASFEGYTHGSWSQLVDSSPLTASYMTVLYRMYGIYCAIFGLLATAIAVTAYRRGEAWAWWILLVGNTVALVSAMRMDWIFNAIGPFELTEYLGLVMVYVALAITAPIRGAARRDPSIGNKLPKEES